MGSLSLLSSLWETEAADERVSTFPLMQGNVTWMLILFSCYLYSVCLLLPDWIKETRKNKKPKEAQSSTFDIQPIQIIYNGFMFGIHGIGAAIGLWQLDASQSWTCTPLSPSHTDPRVMGVIYAS